MKLEGFMKLLLRYLQGSPRTLLACAAMLIAIIAVVDWRIFTNYFGFLYLFPMLLIGPVLSPWQIALTAVFCTVLADIFDPFPFKLFPSLSQDALLFIALSGMGMFSHAVTENRKVEQKNRERIEKEVAARREAEEQLDFVIQTSPVAIVVMDGNGKILIGNSAAYRLFRVDTGRLVGRNISGYIPALCHVPSAEDTNQIFKTEMQCRGQRDDGDIFLANVFFSTYNTAMGPRLAALVVDTSEDFRNRAEYGLEQLMAGSRILVGAVSHEVRNVCSAIAVIYQNLRETGPSRRIRISKPSVP